MVLAVQFFNKMVPTGLCLLESVDSNFDMKSESGLSCWSQDSCHYDKGKNGILCESNIFVL